jgi:hypothetical protein
MTGKWSVNKMINGSLAGLVAICAVADDVEFYNALLIGIIAGAVYEICSRGLLKLQMDDPVGMILLAYIIQTLSRCIWEEVSGALSHAVSFGLEEACFMAETFAFLGFKFSAYLSSRPGV